MDDALKILLLEDNLTDVMLLQHELKRAGMGFSMKVVDTEEEFIRKLNEFRPDVVLSDHSLPSFNSMEALKIVRGKGLDIPFILVTGTVSEEFAVDSMKTGADDYILKDRMARLPAAIQNIFTKKKIAREKETIEMLHIRLQEAYSVIEEKNKNTTDSIEYAKSIQESLLPDEKALRRLYPESFVFQMPKDIIGGDFFWMHPRKDKFMIAVGDCTGHGIPGALMSIIGYTQLEDIVTGNAMLKPAEILTALNSRIRKILKQDALENRSHAGIDIAICSIDKARKVIEFAGAGRPLLRCGHGKHWLTKGDQSGIGGFQLERIRRYQNHLIPYEPGDFIYLFSDGYADQFGGPRKKKMMTSQLINRLESNQIRSAEEQQELLGLWLDKWKGDQEQTDDILVLGLKIPE